MTHTLGDLITELYAYYLELYGDAELASVATASDIEQILAERDVQDAA